MSWGIVASVGGAIVGGMISADGTEDAAETNAGATREGIAEQRRQFDTVLQLLAPYRDAGPNALTAYQNLSGLNGAGPQQAGINGLTGGAEYKSLVKQGENAILQNASATGGLRGGNVQGALGNFRSNLLSSLIDRQLGRYSGLTQLGQNSAAGTASAALTTGQGIASQIQAGGAAQAGFGLAGTNALVNTVGGVGGILASRFAPQPGTAAMPPAVNDDGYSLGLGAAYGGERRGF